MKTVITSLLILAFIAACARDYSLKRAVYEGIQTNEQLKSSPADRELKQPPPTYQQYEEERKSRK